MSKPAENANGELLITTQTAHLRRLSIAWTLVAALVPVIASYTAAGVRPLGAAHAAKHQKGRKSPPLPPLVRPTAPTPAPLTPHQTAEHNRKIRAIRQREP